MQTDPLGFDEFWKIYPRRTEKLHAKKMYDRALKLTTPDRILSAAKRYATERAGKEIQYTKHPGTWLNRGCWDDYQEVPVQGVIIAIGTPQWATWLQYYEKVNPARARFMRHHAENGRSKGWGEASEWPVDRGASER